MVFGWWKSRLMLFMTMGNARSWIAISASWVVFTHSSSRSAPFPMAHHRVGAGAA